MPLKPARRDPAVDSFYSAPHSIADKIVLAGEVCSRPDPAVLVCKSCVQRSIYLFMPAQGREPTFKRFELKAASSSKQTPQSEPLSLQARAVAGLDKPRACPSRPAGGGCSRCLGRGCPSLRARYRQGVGRCASDAGDQGKYHESAHESSGTRWGKQDNVLSNVRLKEAV